jgi:hypothetical protein
MDGIDGLERASEAYVEKRSCSLLEEYNSFGKWSAIPDRRWVRCL